MDHDDEVQEIENDQWNYLDGTPACGPDDPQVPRPGIIEQTVADVTSFLNPFRWFRRKPTRTIQQQAQQTRRVEKKNPTSQPPSYQIPAIGERRPAKRQRAGNFEFGTAMDVGENEMPPNVNFTDDERPPTSVSYMTEDEDSDIEMDGPVASSGHRVNKNRRETQRTVNNSGNSVSVSVPTSKRTPLTERKDLASTNPSTTQPAPSTARRNTLLPLISSVSKAPVSLQHPLMEQTKVMASSNKTPLQPSSRKRTFEHVDEDDSMTAGAGLPKLFSSFPKSSERLSGPPLSRFGPGLNKSVAGPSISQQAAPYYALKRYDGLVNLGNAAKNAPRISNLPPMRPLQAISVKPFLHGAQVSQIPTLRKDLIKLDYSYVIPPVKTPSGGAQEFLFQSPAVVPTGVLKKTLEKFVPQNERDASVSRQSSLSPSTRLCRKCGIKNVPDGGQCDVCERVTTDKRGPLGDSPSPSGRDQLKKTRSAGPLQEVFDVDGETWKCTLCDRENSEPSTACETCGRSKKSNETIQKPTVSKIDRSVPLKAVEAVRTSQPDDEPSRGGEPPAKKTAVLSDQSKASTMTAPSSGKGSESVSVAPTGFIDIWNKSAQKKNWECPMCCCSNAESMDKCPACETLKPGTVAKEAPAASAISTSLFGGLQSAAVIAKPAEMNGPSSGGFNFGPSITGTQSVGGASQSLPATGFSFGISPAPKLDSAPVAVPAFTGFAGLATTNGLTPTTESTVKSLNLAPAATSTPSSFLGLSNGTSTFGIPAPNTSTTAPSGGFSMFGTQPTTTAAAATQPFGGFASNSIPSTTAPSVTGSVFPSGIPTFGSSKSDAPLNFTFGQTTAAPAFTGFGSSISGSQASSNIFGLPNGLATQTNGLAATPASTAPMSIFGGAGGGGGFAAFQPQLPVQNGQSGLAQFPSNLPAPGTFGSVMNAPLGTVGTLGTIGSPAARRVVRAKRNFAK